MTNEEAREILQSIYDTPTIIWTNGASYAFEMAIKALKEQERPTGEWICTFHSTFPQYEPSEYRCSKCNGRGNESDKFCKHCGAKMEEDNNG